MFLCSSSLLSPPGVHTRHPEKLFKWNVQRSIKDPYFSAPSPILPSNSFFSSYFSSSPEPEERKELSPNINLLITWHWSRKELRREYEKGWLQIVSGRRILRGFPALKKKAEIIIIPTPLPIKKVIKYSQGWSIAVFARQGITENSVGFC